MDLVEIGSEDNGRRADISKDASRQQRPDAIVHNVGFYYEHHGEFDYGCQIIVDGKDQYFASTNGAAFAKLTEGPHNIAVKVHVTAGVNSTDVMTSLNLNVMSDCSYLIYGQGTFRRQVVISRRS